MVLDMSKTKFKFKQVRIEAYKEQQLVYLWELNHPKDIEPKELQFREVP